MNQLGIDFETGAKYCEFTDSEAEDFAYMQRTGQGIVVDAPEDEVRAMYPGLFAANLVRYWPAGFGRPSVIRLKSAN